MQHTGTQNRWLHAFLMAVMALALATGCLSVAAQDEPVATLIYTDGRAPDAWHSGAVHFYAPEGYTIWQEGGGNRQQDQDDQNRSDGTADVLLAAISSDRLTAEAVVIHDKSSFLPIR